MSAEMAKALLKEIIPRLGFPISLQSSNCLAFVSQVMKGIMSALGIKNGMCLHSGDPTAIGESRKIHSEFEMGLGQPMSGNSRKLD